MNNVQISWHFWEVAPHYILQAGLTLPCYENSPQSYKKTDHTKHAN